MEKIFNQIKKLRSNPSSEKSTSSPHQRAIAAQILRDVVIKKHTLCFTHEQLANMSAAQVSWIKQVCFGCCRYYFQLEAILNQLLHEPLPAKHADIHCLLILGLYQIQHLSTPHHAAVNETVAAAKNLKKIWAKGLCNKVLRKFIKKQKAIISVINEIPQARYGHPGWLIDLLKEAWPSEWESILEQNNQPPPLFLRVNRQKTSRHEYITLLKEHGLSATTSDDTTDGILLSDARPVNEIPKFSEGYSSVQDVSGQRILDLMALAPEQTVLDACAAPGSKTCHMLEVEPKLKKVVAVDMDAKRLLKIKENMIRLQLSSDPCRMILANACHSKEWWDGELYDRILLDAPCSSTGVIRRHPDIKLCRTPEDIAHITKQQKHLLHSLWPLLKPGGRLIYSTCSILPQENEAQIKQFLKDHSDSKLVKPKLAVGEALPFGHQCFPSENETDGFFYSILQKTKS